MPVVGIFRTTTKEEFLLEYPPGNAEERAALDQAYASGRGFLDKWEADLRAGVPTAKIVKLPGANLYMFVSNEADIMRELRAFGASLPK